ncbi:hypothetical protein GGS20DRAFT_170638 [Poronia punctata]|nr:hypothetical protein GGS20DRAFT_170638 [Poronia punctata]
MRLLTLTPLLALSKITTAQCTRDSLTLITQSLLTAQTTGSPSLLGPLSEITYLEQFLPANISTSILSTPIPLAFNRSLLDTTSCATYTEMISVTTTTTLNNSHPYVIGTQIYVNPSTNTITNISSLVTDQGDWLFNATGTLYWASRERWDVIPESGRDSRETIKAAADAYADVFDDKSVEVPWGRPCARLEGGMYTGTGEESDRCDVGIPSGVKLSNRRYVIDETLGAVDVFIDFASIPDSHEFRVEKGKLRYVHTITVMGG